MTVSFPEERASSPWPPPSIWQAPASSVSEALACAPTFTIHIQPHIERRGDGGALEELHALLDDALHDGGLGVGGELEGVEGEQQGELGLV